MRIENNYKHLNATNNQKYLPPFCRAYFDMRSLNRYGYGKNLIIEALKEKNTPLRNYLKNVVNTKDFENYIGDCYISFYRKRHFGEGGYRFDTICFSFPKMHEQARIRSLDFYENGDLKKLKKEKFEFLKNFMASNTADKTTYRAGFSDNEVQNGAEELANYITGTEIIEDLINHIAKIRTKYLKES